MEPRDSAREQADVLRAIAGDDAAFEALVLGRQAWLRSLLRSFSGDASLADDLAQEVFIKAWRNIGRLDDHRSFGGWLRRIALRTWIDWLRRQNQMFESLNDDDADPAPSDQADQRLDLSAALMRLKPAPRLCAVLFHGEGMSHSEIAAATGLTIGAVKSHIARATPRLRAALSEWRNG